MKNSELSYSIWPGKRYPLGATWDGSGTNFALFSEHAFPVELLLFGTSKTEKLEAVIPLRERTIVNIFKRLKSREPN
jgi:glycogen operon protein